MQFPEEPVDRLRSPVEVCGHGRYRAGCEPCRRLDEVGALTGPWRAGLARSFQRRGDFYAALAGAARDAESARYLGAPPMSPEAIAELHAAFSVGAKVERVRRRMVSKKDRKGRARRYVETSRVAIPAADAYASTSRWHEGRARGQRTRGTTVEHCGVGKLRTTCGSCGVVHEQRVFCGVVRLCEGCSKRRAEKQRRRLAISIPYVVENARRQGAFLRYRKGGALSEKHLVLTVPHVEADAFGAVARMDVAMWRIAILFAAWRLFSLRLQAFLRTVGSGKIGSCFHRAFEWTPGADGLGHPHFHVWMLGPFLPEYDDHPGVASIESGSKRSSTRCRGQGCELCAAGCERRTGVRTWWADALERASDEQISIGPAALVLTVRKVFARAESIIHEVQKSNGTTYQRRGTRLVIRAAGSDDLIGYLEGWCVSALDPETRELCGAEVIAGVEKALEGKRLSQSSKVTLLYNGKRIVKGLMAIADERVDTACRDCVAHAVSSGIEWGFSEKRVEVSSWDKELARAWAPVLPDATGPPDVPAESFADFVAGLRRGDPSELAKVDARARRTFENIEGVREFYARPGMSRPRVVMTFRDRMRASAKARRRAGR